MYKETTLALSPAEPYSLLSKEVWRTQLDRMSYTQYDARRAYIDQAGFFILTAETAEVLATFLKDKKTLEVAAGTGYLAYHLRKLGVTDYLAVDNRSSHYPTDAPNHGVELADAFDHLDGSHDVVVMTWPGYNEPFAASVAIRMRSGQILIYQGESAGGCTGDDEFHDLLDTHFESLETIDDALHRGHVQWFGMHDYWAVYKKR